MVKLVSVVMECYAGYRAEESPRAFILEGVRYEVVRIEDRWYEGGVRPGRPRLDYFKVRTRDGRRFILRYNALFDAWAALVKE